jgi:FkbM family methyltransferase
MILTTKAKMILARMAQRPVVGMRRLTGRGLSTVVRRRGVTWHLDLSEGIDFYIWLRGYFEPRTVAAYRSVIRPGDNVIDIGANMGAHTLHLAAAVGPSGHVLACEPTAHAFERLKVNIDANPSLAGQVHARQVMLLERRNASLPAAVISSWPLEKATDIHPTLMGRANSTLGATATTVDDLVAKLGMRHVELIKLDVDGYECEVLDGARDILEHHRPVIVSELAPGAFADRGRSVGELLDRFDAANYRLEPMGRRTAVDRSAVDRLERRGVSMNVIARPVP